MSKRKAKHIKHKNTGDEQSPESVEPILFVKKMLSETKNMPMSGEQEIPIGVEDDIVVDESLIKKSKKKNHDTPKRNAHKESVQEAHINEQLAEIYENEDGSMPDMRHFQQHRRSRLIGAMTTLLVACVFLGAVAWAGFFVLQPQSAFSESNVTLSIIGDEHVATGERVRYRIRYRNDQGIPLQEAVLHVRYPAGFIFEDASMPTSNEDNNAWDLGMVQEHASGFIDIFGTLVGDVGDRQSFRLFFNYTPTNFSSEFQTVASVNVELNTAPVTLVIGGPDEFGTGKSEEFIFTIQKVQGASLESIKALALVIDPVDGFHPEQSSQVHDERNPYQWSFILGEDEEVEIRITGRFESVDGEPQVRAHIRGWTDEALHGDGFVLADAQHAVVFRDGDRQAQLAINGGQGQTSGAPGDWLNASVVVRNDGEDTMTNNKVQLVFDAPSVANKSILDWARLEDEADGDVVGEQINDQIRRGSITWDLRHIPALRSIEGGEQVIIDIRLPIKKGDQTDLNAFAASNIRATVQVQTGPTNDREIFSSNPVVIAVESDLALDVRDDVVNEGEQETHTITWLLSNSFHDLEDITLSADLFGKIVFDSQNLIVPAGDAIFDKEAQSLTWKIDTMPTAIDVLALQFEIRLTEKNPTQTNLSSKVRILAKDAITGQTIVRVGDEILLKAE
jgi:hypothetical protein